MIHTSLFPAERRRGAPVSRQLLSYSSLGTAEGTFDVDGVNGLDHVVGASERHCALMISLLISVCVCG
jgi:hypothetical protein